VARCGLGHEGPPAAARRQVRRRVASMARPRRNVAAVSSKALVAEDMGANRHLPCRGGFETRPYGRMRPRLVPMGPEEV
jgi:hypothetical protein